MIYQILIVSRVPAFLNMGKPTYSFPISIFVECSIGRKYPHYEISTFTVCHNEYLLQHFGPTETLCSMNFFDTVASNPNYFCNFLLQLHQIPIFLQFYCYSCIKSQLFLQFFVTVASNPNYFCNFFVAVASNPNYLLQFFYSCIKSQLFLQFF